MIDSMVVGDMAARDKSPIGTPHDVLALTGVPPLFLPGGSRQRMSPKPFGRSPGGSRCGQRGRVATWPERREQVEAFVQAARTAFSP